MLSLPRQELKGHFTMLPMDEVHFGSGSLDNLSAELEKQGVNRAVVVTGNPRPMTSTDEVIQLLHKAW